MFFCIAGLCAAIVFEGIHGLALCAAICALGYATAWRHALLRTRVAVLEIDLEDSAQATAVLRDGSIVHLRQRGSRAGNMGAYIAGRGRWAIGILILPGLIDRQDVRIVRIWCRWARLDSLGTKGD